MPTQKEVWNQIDHRLVSLKLQPLAHQRERETDKKRAEIHHSNPGTTAKAYKLFELEIEQMRKWPEAVYPVYKEVWQKQGKKMTSHFVRAVFHKAIVPVIETRKGCSRELLTNHATRTGMSRSLLGPQVQELEREAARLIAEWRRRTEIEALEIEHEQKNLRNTSARAMAEKERKEAQPVRPITKAPKPLTPLSGRGMLRGPKPTQMPLHWPPYYPIRRWAETACNFVSAEDFARSLASELNVEISRMSFSNQRHSGIGIHFAAYERVEGYWIPELFLISNWTDPSYRCVCADGVGVSRETYHTLTEQSPRPEHRQPQCRIAVHQHLLRGGWLIYNNGDPAMFNPTARALFQILEVLSNRGLLANQDAVETYLAIARRPIEIVAKAQSDFCGRGFRIVGGKPHDLGITPNGLYSSTTGDI